MIDLLTIEENYGGSKDKCFKRKDLVQKELKRSLEASEGSG